LEWSRQLAVISPDIMDHSRWMVCLIYSYQTEKGVQQRVYCSLDRHHKVQWIVGCRLAGQSEAQ
jgi:hypothetical protein